MGAPMPDMEKAENASAEALLSSLETIDPAERRKHASVFNYWLSIRGPRQFPPIRDLDPLEISDAGPWSVLLEMIGGGEDAVVRHFGQSIRDGAEVEHISEAPTSSLLACIHAKLPTVAASRQPFAFEDAFEASEGMRRCWVTLLPFSANGAWIDFVYGYVSLDGGEPAAEEMAEPAPEMVEETAEVVDEPSEEAADPYKLPFSPVDGVPENVEALAEPIHDLAEPEPDAEPEPLSEEQVEAEPEAADEYEAEPETDSRPSFTSKFMDSLGGFYGKSVQVEPGLPAEAFVEDEISEPACEVSEGALQNKLSDVRALAQEAHEAQVRSNVALYEGLGAAYDFALDAEEAPEEYLRMVEARGLKIQLRAPMKPVVKLAFDGMCDEPTIAKLEAVLAWALKHDLPRGSLAERIQAEGGIGPILNAKAT